MKTREVTKILKNLGWRAFTDEVGDKYTHYYLSDRIVEIIYGVSGYEDEQWLESTLSLTTAVFSSVCSVVDEGSGDYDPLEHVMVLIFMRRLKFLKSMCDKRQITRFSGPKRRI